MEVGLTVLFSIHQSKGSHWLLSNLNTQLAGFLPFTLLEILCVALIA